MVATSIHGLALSSQATSPPPDRNTASSQGALMEIMDAIRRAFGPKIDPQQLLGIIAIRLEPTDPFGNLFPGTT